MSRFSLQPTFDTLQYGKPRFASPFVIWSCLSLRGGGGRLLNKCLYGEVPPRSPSPYPFIYYLACEQAKCKPARRGKGKGNPFLGIFFTLPPNREPVFTGYKPFFYEKGTPSAYLLLTNGASFTYLLLALWTILQTHMTDFPTLSYTSTSKIPTL